MNQEQKRLDNQKKLLDAVKSASKEELEQAEKILTEYFLQKFFLNMKK